MEASSDANFKQNYPLHPQHLKLKGLHPKTVKPTPAPSAESVSVLIGKLTICQSNSCRTTSTGTVGKYCREYERHSSRVGEPLPLSQFQWRIGKGEDEEEQVRTLHSAQ